MLRDVIAGFFEDIVYFIIVAARMRGALGLSAESNETDELIELPNDATRSRISGLFFLMMTSCSRYGFI